MQKIGCLFACACLCFSASVFASPSWTIRPSVCIADALGSRCSMEITIETHGLNDETYCLYQNETLLSCWPGRQSVHQVQISYDDDVTLILMDSKGQVRLEHSMTIKVRAVATSRRRVRQPWSVF